jgi:predicted transcriptional regulator
LNIIDCIRSGFSGMAYKCDKEGIAEADRGMLRPHEEALTELKKWGKHAS